LDRTTHTVRNRILGEGCGSLKHVSSEASIEIQTQEQVGPALGAAGLSLSLAGGASATTGALTANMLAPNNEARQEVSPGEEEIYDVALATFYVINKESPAFQPRRQFAMGGGGGCGCCAGCAAATGSYGAWTPESDGDLSQRSIKPAHPPKRTHVSRSP
jgi:hypothetical protein